MSRETLDTSVACLPMRLVCLLMPLAAVAVLAPQPFLQTKPKLKLIRGGSAQAQPRWLHSVQRSQARAHAGWRFWCKASLPACVAGLMYFGFLLARDIETRKAARFLLKMAWKEAGLPFLTRLPIAVVQVFAGIGGLVGCMILFRVPCGCRGPVWARMFFPLMRQCIAEMAFDVLRALRPTLPRLQTVAGICTYAFVVHQLLLGGALQQRVVTGLTLLLGLISWAPPTSPPVPSAVKRLRGGDDALARLRGGARTEDLSTLPGRILRVFWNVVLFSVAFAVYPISPAICVNTSHKMLPTYLLPPWLVLIVLPCSLHEWDKHLKELRKWKSIHEPDGNDRRPPLSA